MRETLDKQKGLKPKYAVFKSESGEAVPDCFVLRPDKDPAAVTAIRAYAAATGNAKLASDLIQWVGPEPPLTLDKLREMDGEPVWVEDLLIPKCSCYHFVQKIGNHVLLMEPRYYPAENVMIPHYCANDENQGYGRTWLAYRRKEDSHHGP